MSALTTIDRFWAKVDKTPGHGPNGDCWLWTGAKCRGYGAFRDGDRTIKAHRKAFELGGGEAPPERLVLHSCDMPACVNPAHLRHGTAADNMKDSVQRDRRAKFHRRLRPMSNNTSGVLGVSWDRRGKRWMACYKIPGGRNLLKYFKTKEAAIAQRQEWEHAHSPGQ